MREIYDLNSLHDYSWPVVMAACTTEATAMTWCRKVGLLPTTRPCPQCTEMMQLAPDGRDFRCCRSSCRLDPTWKKGAFFEGQGLKLHKAVMLLFYWANQEKATSAHQLGRHSTKTVTDWYSFCRDVCTKCNGLCLYRY
ncbi:hypothetical protein DVH05_006267 [Phytophthora capsici]|nr:hypothetical protein DVH05_006267 [Phytophthora capsici]